MTKWMISIFAGFLAVTGFAFAEEITPGTNSDDNAAVQARIDPWLDEVEIYRAATDALSTLWQAGDAEAQADTVIYAQLGAQFVIATRATSAAIRELSPGNDAACIMRGISLDVTERLDALAEAADPASHMQVLSGIDRLLYEGLLIFGREEEARLARPAPIRVAYVLKSASKGETRHPSAVVNEECDEAPNPSK